MSPSELEETLLECKGIRDAGVVGVPHSRFGEAPVAFIVRDNDSLTENDVHSFMNQRLSKHKQLVGGIKFVDELPKSQTGKLLRRILMEMAKENN